MHIVGEDRRVDEIAARMFREAGAESTAKGYFGYPGHICVSVNDEVETRRGRQLMRGDVVRVGDTSVRVA